MNCVLVKKIISFFVVLVFFVVFGILGFVLFWFFVNVYVFGFVVFGFLVYVIFYSLWSKCIFIY